VGIPAARQVVSPIDIADLFRPDRDLGRRAIRAGSAQGDPGGTLEVTDHWAVHLYLGR